MIDLKQLINTSPFPKETKDEILGKFDTLSEEQKNDFENLCWELIAEEYENKVSFALQSAIGQVTEGKPAPSPEELERIEKDIFNELIEKLNAAEDQEKIDEVRTKIAASSPKV